MKLIVSFLVLLNLILSVVAFQCSTSFPRLTTIQLQLSSNSNENNNQLGGDLATKGLFGLTELFGKITNPFMSTSNSLEDEDADTMITNNKPSTKTKSKDLLTIANNIKKEYEKIFWATGNMDTSVT